MAADTGMTHSAASAIRQSNANRLSAMITVEIKEPNRPGIK